MEQLAEAVSEAVVTEFDESCLVGVSYYDEDEVGHVYRSEWAAETYDPEQVTAIVEDLQLEALGYVSHERRQEQTIHATARIYDEMLDITVPVSELSGVAVALDTDGDYRIRDVVDVVEQAIEESHVAPESLWWT